MRETTAFIPQTLRMHQEFVLEITMEDQKDLFWYPSRRSSEGGPSALLSHDLSEKLGPLSKR